MSVIFDKIASSYDETFTYSEVGKRQRDIVWNYLDRSLPANIQLDILELNCGTGEDALFFAKRGNKITATDESDEMLNITNRKVAECGLEENIYTQKINIEELNRSTFNKKFDLIFSNFGGMNCIDAKVLGNLSNQFELILNATGRIIIVLMSNFCLWESVYFLTKFKIDYGFRRSISKSITANVGGQDVKVYYYSLRKIEKLFSEKFVVKEIVPVGFFIPPSYLNSFFTKKKKTLNFLTALEKKTSGVPLLSKAADHFLIDMQLRE